MQVEGEMTKGGWASKTTALGCDQLLDTNQLHCAIILRNLGFEFAMALALAGKGQGGLCIIKLDNQTKLTKVLWPQ